MASSETAIDVTQDESYWTLERLKEEGSKAGLWLFGYGSLVWRPDFDYTEKHYGYAKGFVRRFWQASPDHRGTPECLGRVCTLAHANMRILFPGEHPHAFGAVYHVAANNIEVELERLFFREKAGYTVLQVPVECRDGVTRLAFTFTANHTNTYWRGPNIHIVDVGSDSAISEEEMEKILDVDNAAQIIRTVSGPSGPNIEYFLKLYQHLKELEVEDVYLQALYEKVSAAT